MKEEFKIIANSIQREKSILDVGFVEIVSDKGHDSFLLDVPDFLNALKNFLDKSYIELENEK